MSGDDSVTSTGPRVWGRWRRLFFGNEPPSPEDVPDRIGRYRILSLLGEGGMGRVYVAEDETLQRRVAVKTLKEWDERSTRRFLREARAAARVSHPNVCPIYEVGEDGGRLFLATELLEGETLAHRLLRGPLVPAEALTLAREMLAALETLHEASIIHRDLKPSNVFLTVHGARLLDFGLARELPGDISRELASDGDLTRPGVILGTPGYMAPEQILGRDVGAHTDLFAVGIILYEALSGRRPFPGSSAVQLLSAILHEEPPPLAGPAPVVALDLPIRRALAKPPDRRFASAREMAHALEAAAGSAAAGRAPASREVFVGRQDELAELEERLAVAMAGTGSVVFLTGERGVGKSMLVSEFLRRVASRDVPVTLAAGRCVESQGPGEPFQPFRDGVGRLLLSPARDHAAELLRTYAPTLCVLFGTGLVPDPDGAVHREAVGATRERLLREAGDFMEAAARAFPLVLYLEDLHWADSASVDLLHHISCRVARQRTLIIGTYRRADVDAGHAPLKRCVLDLLARGAGSEIHLGFLSPENVQEYLDARFSPNRFPPSLASVLHARTEGLALFVRSLVDLLRDRGEIAREDGVGLLTRPVEELDLEPTKGLLDLVRHHIELLPEEKRKILQHASVSGREFLSVVVASLLDADEAEVEEGLQSLSQVRRLIEERGEEELPDGTLATRYRFAHGLYQSVLYQDLVASRRVRIHRRISDQLRRHWGADAPRLAADIARHCELGRDFEGAVTFRLHVADNALRSFAFEEAAEQCEWASRLIEKVPAESRREAELTLYRTRGTVRHAQARFDEAAADFHSMLEASRANGSTDAESAALAGLCDALFFARRVDEMAVHARELLDTATRSGHHRDACEARARLGQVLVCEGRFAEAISLLDEVVEAAREVGPPIALQLGLSCRGVIHYWQTEHQDAERLFAEAATIAADRGGAFDVLAARMFVGLSRVKLGRISEGLGEFREAIALARRNGDRFWLPRLISHMGWAHREVLAPERAREFAVEAVQAARETALPHAPETETLLDLVVDEVRLGNVEDATALLAELESKVAQGNWFRWMDELRLAAVSAEHWTGCGDRERAAEAADRLLKLSRRLGAREYRCAAERIRAEAALACGEGLGTAARRLDEALSDLRESPSPLETWKAARLLGRIALQLDDKPGARRAFAESAQAAQTIAGGINDTRLREGFLAAEPVHQVVSAAGI